jgi:two-component system, NarL family, sensor kinase
VTALARRHVTALAPLAACVLVMATIAWLEATYPARNVEYAFATDSGAWTAMQGLTLGAAAALLLWRGDSVLGWVMAAFGGLWAVDGLLETYIRVGLGPEDAWLGMDVAIWFVARFFAVLLPTLVLLLLLFPTGRFVEGRWGAVAKATVVLEVAAVAVFLVVPYRDFDRPVTVPPDVDLNLTTIDALAPVSGELVLVARLVLVLGFVAPVATVVLRHRRAREIERDRMRWLLWGVLVAIVYVAATSVLGLVSWPVQAVGFNIPFVAMVVGLVNPTLVRIDELLSRTLVFVLLSASVVLVDLAALAALTQLLDDRLDERQVVVVVLLVSVLLYNPLRTVLLARVRRLVLGDRDNPYDVVSGLAETLESTDDSERQLAAVATAVAQAFGVGFVTVEVDRGAGERVGATVGERPEHTRTLPITFRGEEVGRLVLPRRGVRASLGRTDERLLGDLVRQAASAARATQLAAELQEDRERLVMAREEELRRIRRDLHDGLGPALGGAVFQLESARLVAAADPGRARTRLAETRAHLQDVVADVRRLVHDLRPPALDDLGLVGALRQQARHDDAAGGLAVTVEAGDLPDLPAAVEVAAYRIVGEALTNVRRHADATTCSVRLAVEDDALVVEVADDGVGVDPDRQAGVGLLSLRERAGELGGQSEVVCPPGGGTLVRARLPLHPLDPETDVPHVPSLQGAPA